MSTASNTPADALLYKLVDRKYWESHTQEGHFDGAGVDLTDGFIHFSNAQQLPETVSKHYRDQHDLVLVAVEASTLGAALRYETSRNNEEFGHLYGRLDMRSVVWIRPFMCAYCDPKQIPCHCL